MAIADTRHKILIVDDSTDNIHILLEAFRDEYATMVATSGKKALRMAALDPRPDIVLLDVTMPDMDGYEVCSRLKLNETTASIPVIFVTSRTDEEDERSGLDLGAVDYIHKPVTPELVISRVRNHIELKTYRDHLEELVRQRTDELLVANNSLHHELEERKKYQEILYYQANYDQLTQLPNRFQLKSRLARHVDSNDLRMGRFCLMLLDIDHLKFVNDSLGHEFGDKLLTKVSERLRSLGDEGYIVARFSGDKFVMSFPVSDGMEPALVIAERIRSAMNDSYQVENTEVFATVSIGVVTFPEDGDSVEVLLKNAEITMYRAKQNGRNRVEGYCREQNADMQQRLLIQTKLYRALDRGEFRLHYQPQCHAPSGKIIGVEALLRWEPAGEAPVPPARFIPLLEESGMMVEVGEWILQEACSQAVAWQNSFQPQFRISVNISVMQLMSGNLETAVARVLADTGISPGELCLELTESMIMTDSLKLFDKLASIRQSGIVLSLDDFGTGYSSLSYLGRLEINELKIDQSFVRRMLSSQNDAVVVSAIIAMAQELGMELVAEGVETVEQMNYLIRKNCSVMQGYLFSAPLTTEEMSQKMTIRTTCHRIDTVGRVPPEENLVWHVPSCN